MTVRDETALLERCLASVAGVVDEVVVVDTGSSDGTPELARRLGARVLHHAWRDDFSASRNQGLAAATGDWILVLDADEVLLPGGQTALRQALEGPYDAYVLPLENLTGEAVAPVAHRVMLLRLFRRDTRVRFRGRVHEQVTASLEAIGARIGVCQAPLRHDGYLAERVAARDKHGRNLALLERMLAQDPADTYARYQLGKTLLAMGRLDEARSAFSEAIDRLAAEPDPARIAYYPRVFTHLAAMLEPADPAGSLAILDRGLERLPASAELWLQRGRQHLAAGSLERALRDLAAALEHGRRPQAAGFDGVGLTQRALTMAGEALWGLGQRSQAAQRYREAAQLAGPEAVEPWLRLATSLLQLGDAAGARQAYETVIARDPDQLPALLALATLYFEAQDWGRVRSTLEAAERVRPGLPEVAALRALCRRIAGA